MENHSKKLIRLTASILLIPAISMAFQPNDNVFFNLPPRISVWGSGGTGTFGESDVMASLWGNSDQSIYGDFTGKYGNNNSWLASFGLGTRHIVFDSAILGAYVFGDYNKTPSANYFPVVNPGIEVMTNHWDGHVNGYLPVGQQSKLIGTTNAIFFSGHAEYANPFDQFENVGPGSDVEVGRTFLSLNRTRVFVGGYYFDPKNTSNIRGGEGGIEMPFRSWASLGVSDSYDNVFHNTVAVTLRLTFGGLDKTGPADIEDRMLDLIPRHLGNLRTGDGIPSQKSNVNSGNLFLLRNNIWFFNPDAGTNFSGFAAANVSQPTTVTTYQSCTFEHPCIGLTQTRIDQINGLAPNANFFLSSGTYNNPDVGMGYSFNNGQNVFGRTPGFVFDAAGSARPLLNDSLLLNGNNNILNVRINGNTVSDLDFFGPPTTQFQTGVFVMPTAIGSVNIFNSDINASSNLNQVLALVSESNSMVNVFNSRLTANYQNEPPVAVGIGVLNLRDGILNINNSIVTASQSDTFNNGDTIIGALNSTGGTLNITGSRIMVTANNAENAYGVTNNATFLPSLAGTVNINRSVVSVTTFDSRLVADVFNTANNIANVSGNINIEKSSLAVTSQNGFNTAGIVNAGTGAINLDNSRVTANADNGEIIGIFNGGTLSSAINFRNSTVAVNVTGTAFGFITQSFVGGSINNLGGNQCFLNGTPSPC